MENWQDLQDNDINQFISNYRDTLEQQRDLTKQNLQQQRENDFASIMSNANARGMLYSNFPARDKIKYDVSTYQPGIARAQQSYQTGLDKLRANAIKAWNQNKAIEEKIADLQELDNIESSGTTNNTTTKTGSNTATVSQNGADFQFRDANGNPITFYEYAANHNQLGVDALKTALNTMQNAGDVNARRALAAINNANNQMTAEEKIALEALGIPTTGFSLRQ